ncbi:Ythdc2, partial [Symbiodinium natans]
AAMLDGHRPPEMLRSALDDVCLHAQLVLTRQGRQDVSVEDFLRGAPDPPEERSVRNAQQLLREIGALTAATVAEDEDKEASEVPRQGLTALGVHLCSLPLSPQFAKMVIWANLLGVGGAALAVVSGLQYREPFVSLGDAQRSLSLAQANKAVRAAKRALSAPESSDHVALWAATIGFEAARLRGGDHARRFCEANCLSFRQMQTSRQTSAKLRAELRGGKPCFQIEDFHLAGSGVGELRLTASELQALQQYLSGLGLTDVELEPCADEASAQPVVEAKISEATPKKRANEAKDAAQEVVSMPHPKRVVEAKISEATPKKRANEAKDAAQEVVSVPHPKRVRAASPDSDAGTPRSLTPTSRSSTPERDLTGPSQDPDGNQKEKEDGNQDGNQKEKEAKRELQRMIDQLDDDKLAKLIELSQPDKDPKTGEHILGYDKLAPDKRESFRQLVAQLLKEQEKDTEDMKCGKATCVKRPIAPADEHEQAVQEMLREFESWI